MQGINGIGVARTRMCIHSKFSCLAHGHFISAQRVVGASLWFASLPFPFVVWLSEVVFPTLAASAHSGEVDLLRLLSLCYHMPYFLDVWAPLADRICSYLKHAGSPQSQFDFFTLHRCQRSFEATLTVQQCFAWWLLTREAHVGAVQDLIIPHEVMH